jgi:hypothetical protein
MYVVSTYGKNNYVLGHNLTSFECVSHNGSTETIEIAKTSIFVCKHQWLVHFYWIILDRGGILSLKQAQHKIEWTLKDIPVPLHLPPQDDVDERRHEHITHLFRWENRDIQICLS